jgi:hypothetical protein
MAVQVLVTHQKKLDSFGLLLNIQNLSSYQSPPLHKGNLGKAN